MSLHLSQIDRVKTITKNDFIKNYFEPQKPVVIEHFIEDWPAYSKWNLNYIKEVAGDKIVPLYDDRPVDYKDGFNEPHATMKMSEYVDLLKSKPTKFRIFLWNVLKEIPALQKDFTFPDFGLRLMKGLPMLFFGGTDSYTFMHYDIDLANIFHFHFEGKKEVILFDQKQNKYLYKIPHSLIVREDIDFSNPDFDKWPALKHAKGWVCNLNQTFVKNKINKIKRSDYVEILFFYLVYRLDVSTDQCFIIGCYSSLCCRQLLYHGSWPWNTRQCWK